MNTNTLSDSPRDLVVDSVRKAAHPLQGAADDYDPLLDLIGDARFVLIGEGSHGTHEFYRERAQITKRLIREKGFNAVAVEADWPDAYRVNRYVRGRDNDAEAIDALAGFQRFPAWMWRNADGMGRPRGNESVLPCPRATGPSSTKSAWTGFCSTSATSGFHSWVSRSWIAPSA